MPAHLVIQTLLIRHKNKQDYLAHHFFQIFLSFLHHNWHKIIIFQLFESSIYFLSFAIFTFQIESSLFLSFYFCENKRGQESRRISQCAVISWKWLRFRVLLWLIIGIIFVMCVNALSCCLSFGKAVTSRKPQNKSKKRRRRRRKEKKTRTSKIANRNPRL